MIDIFVLLVASALSPVVGQAHDGHTASPATKARPATPKSDIARLFGAATYPAAARAKGLEGKNAILLTIDATGMVIACTVTATSGHPELDSGSCRVARRVRFEPARDERGRRVVSQFPMQADWRLDAI